jgi:hypothetical protein
MVVGAISAFTLEKIPGKSRFLKALALALLM